MVKALTAHELREIKTYLSRIHVGPAQVDRFMRLISRVDEIIEASKPERKTA